MYNTPYLQQLYQANRQQIDAAWNAWAAANPTRAASLMQQRSGAPLPSAGPINYQTPTAQNFPTGNPPTFAAPTGYDPLGSYYDPGGGWHTGTPTGDFGTQDGGGSQPGGGGFDWKQLILHGIPIVQGFLEARAGAKEAKNVQKGMERQRAETLGFASPDTYIANYEKYRKEFQDTNRPWLVGEQDRAAIGEQNAMQAFDTDVARRGLSGSGLALAGRSAIRTGRQAQIGENMRRYWSENEAAARDAATQTRSAQVNASMGAPYTYVPRPSTLTGVTQGLGDAYRDWLWLQGTDNNPFVSKKDQRNVYG